MLTARRAYPFPALAQVALGCHFLGKVFFGACGEGLAWRLGKGRCEDHLRAKTTIAVGIVVVFVTVTAIYLWNPFAWRPDSRDVVMVNRSGLRPSILLWIEYYEKDRPRPYHWSWRIEFYLENKYKEDLDLEVVLQKYSDDLGEWTGSSKYAILVPSKGRKKVQLGMGFNTASKDVVPQGIYRILARTELTRKSGIEVKTHDFEWELASGWVNRTTRTHIPDDIPVY